MTIFLRQSNKIMDQTNQELLYEILKSFLWQRSIVSHAA